MKHVTRALLLFVFIVLVFISAIFTLRALGEEYYPGIPDSLLGVKGLYGYDRNEKVIIRNEPDFLGKEYCKNCHEEIYEKSLKGKHDFECETCHGAGKDHPDKDLSVENTRDFCLNCHKPVIARPDFSLVYDWETHGYPDKPCTVCHDPHYPWFG